LCDVLRDNGSRFKTSEVEKVFLAFLNTGLQTTTIEEISNAFIKGDNEHFQYFCEIMSRAQHLHSLIEMSKLESFLFFFYGFICDCRNDDTEAFVEGLKEVGLSPEEQIALYMDGFDREDVPTEELHFELITILARLAGTDIKVFAQKHDTIAEYLEEYYEEDI
jgi:hypothetical protein